MVLVRYPRDYGGCTDASNSVRPSRVWSPDPQLWCDDLRRLRSRPGHGGLAARREKVDPNAVYELATWLFLGGVIGARAFFFVQHPEALHEPSDLFRTWQGGNVFYGCILGGLTGSILYWLRRPFPFLRMADAVAPAVAIGAALGRIGCFLNGCCHGAVCHLPWAVRFPAGSHAWARQVNDGLISTEARLSLPVHPTQLYSFLAGLVVLGLLLLYVRSARSPGKVMALLMIAYSVTRWPIEAMRSDEPVVFAGMTWSQNISAALIVGGVAIWFGRRQPSRGDTQRTRIPLTHTGMEATSITYDQGH